MAAGADKTERPTPKKLEDARKKGSVGRSIEVPSALVLFGALVVLLAFGGTLYRNIVAKMKSSLLLEQLPTHFTIQATQKLTLDTALFIIESAAPIMAVAVLLGIAGHVGQIGFRITPGALTPSLSKILVREKPIISSRIAPAI